MNEFKYIMAAADILVSLWIGYVAFIEHKKGKPIYILILLVFLFLASSVAIMR